MSYFAQGWAQRQHVGDPIAKSVFLAMCYLMSDEKLLVFPSVSTLCSYTEFEERAVRKAMKRLADDGWLKDTSRRVNNITVWRIPRYEAWLARDVKSTPGNGRALDIAAIEAAQAFDSENKTAPVAGESGKPSPTGEGTSTGAPPTQQAPPSTSSSPPVDGSQSSSDPPLSQDTRAGARARDGAEVPPFDPEAARARWAAFIVSGITGKASALQITRYGTRSLSELPYGCREHMTQIAEELVTWALEEEARLHPLRRGSRIRIETDIDGRVNRELKVHVKTYADRSAAS